MLTTTQIQKLLALTQQEVVAVFNGYTVIRRGSGYSDDPELAAIQAALSIMLQVATSAEGPTDTKKRGRR